MTAPIVCKRRRLIRSNDRRGLLALAAVTVLAYLPAIFAGFIWDDPDYVLNNLTLRSAGGLLRMWTVPTSLPQWYPMVHTTFWIEYHLWRLNPIGYHVDNILLQIAGAILLWKLLRMLKIPGAWLAAALFAVHPIHVESVAWVTERKNTLSTVFYLLAALTYFRAAGVPGETQRVLRIGWWMGSIALFAAALFSKTVACTLPAAILLIVYWKTARIRARDVWPTLPLFALGLILGLFTAFLERTHVGATGAPWKLSGADRLLIAGRAIWFYAGKLAIPWPLAFIYAKWSLNDRALWQYLFPLSVAGVIAALWLLRRTIGRGVLTGVLFFVGTMFPALGFFNTYPMRYSFVADHFQHLASIGLTTLLGVGLAKFAHRSLGRAIAIAVLVVCMGLSFRQCRVYADARTLWTDTMEKTPGSWMVYTNLAHVFEAEGRPLDGVPLHERALQLAPELEDTHQNVAEGLMLSSRLDEAEVEFHKALQINPRFKSSYLGLAKLEFFHRHDPAGAEPYFQKCFAIDPHDGATNFAYAEMLESRGDFSGAADHYREATASLSQDFDAHYNLGSVLLKSGRPSEAIEPLAKAMELNGDQAAARHNLEAALRQCGRNAEAESLERAAIRFHLQPR